MTSTRFGNRGLVTCAIGAVCVVIGFCGEAVRAQSQGESMPSTRRLASDSLARLAITSLRDIPEPEQDDYRLTALALSISRRLDPSDTELLRLEIDAWNAAGDEQRSNGLLRELVKIDPKDTVALLTVINSRIKALQTADERLAAYARLIDAPASAIDPSIRSRLELDAALLMREMGDETGFVDLLTRATTSDVTNKDAAALYATYFLDRTDDPLIRAELFGNIVLADPVDAAALTNLAVELLKDRAFQGAKRFFARAKDVYDNAEVGLGPEDLFDRILTTWMADGDEAALKAILDLRNQQQSYLNLQRRERIALGLDPGSEEIAKVPPLIELLRLALAFASGDSEQARNSLSLITDQITEQLQLLADREEPYDEIGDEEVRSLALQTKLQLLLADIWAGANLDAGERMLDELVDDAQQSGLTPEAVQRFRGLFAVRKGQRALIDQFMVESASKRTAAAVQGDPVAAMRALWAFSGGENEALERGRVLLEPLAATDRLAQLGLGILAETEGDTDEAVRLYAGLALDYANSAIGAAGLRRAELLLGRPIQQSEKEVALERFASDFAPWLEGMTSSPRRSIGLTAEHSQRRYGALGRMMLRITVRNMSRHPLAFGPGEPIDSQILLAPRVRFPNRGRSQLEMPEVLDLNRRLRLMPGETLSTDVWTNRGSVGLMLNLTIDTTATIRWRVLQGYKIDNEGQYAKGDLSLSTETDLVVRERLPDRTEADALAVHIATATGDALIEDLVLAAASGAKRIEGITRDEDQRRLARLSSAVADRFSDMDVYLRTFAVAEGLRGGLLGRDTALLQTAVEDESVFVRAALLIGALRGIDDPAIDQFAVSSDPVIREMAQIVRARHQRFSQKSEGQ